MCHEVNQLYCIHIFRPSWTSLPPLHPTLLGHHRAPSWLVRYSGFPLAIYFSHGSTHTHTHTHYIYIYQYYSPNSGWPVFWWQDRLVRSYRSQELRMVVAFTACSRGLGWLCWAGRKEAVGLGRWQVGYLSSSKAGVSLVRSAHR